ncbi:uncharacterized protein LOC130010247 [Patella vulgata]|uniref:uncharacterized protein LOC130010247 n=1 Tax=Patella vulgata TaxID=6465 RepID=UPI00217FEE99|nr:uncharacterized protein LOC130010247 [Patella vulgata]
MDRVISKTKLSGKKYHYCVLYNYVDGPASHRDNDQKLSRAFLAKMEDELTGCGFTDGYYFEKILPGSNLFEVYSATFIEPCEKVVVILTKGFRDNCWHKYTQQTSFMKLINGGKTATFLPIVIGEKREHIPRDLGLDMEQILFFEEKWEDDEDNWCRLKYCFLENKSIPALFERSKSIIPVEETQDVNSLAEDGVPATGQDLPNVNNLSIDGRPLSHPSGAACGSKQSKRISCQGGATGGLSCRSPTTKVNSNPSGPRVDPVGAARSFTELPLKPPDDSEEDRPPSTPQTIVIPEYAPDSIHISKAAHQEKGHTSGSVKANPAEQKKSSYYRDVLNFILGNV